MFLNLKRKNNGKSKKKLTELTKKSSFFGSHDASEDNSTEINEEQQEREAILKQQKIAEKNIIIAEEEYADSDIFRYDEYYEDKLITKQKQEEDAKKDNNSKYLKGFIDTRKERERRKLVSEKTKFNDDKSEGISENACVFESSSFQRQKQEINDIIHKDQLQEKKESDIMKGEMANNSSLRRFYLQTLGDEFTMNNDEEGVANSNNTKNLYDCDFDSIGKSRNINTIQKEPKTSKMPKVGLNAVQQSNHDMNKKMKLSDDRKKEETANNLKNIIKVYIETSFITKDELSSMRERYLKRKLQRGL